MAAATFQVKVDAREVLSALSALSALSKAAWEVAWYQETGVPWELSVGTRVMAAIDVSMVPGLPPMTQVRIRGTALELPISRLEVVQTPNDRQTVLRIDVPIYRDTVSIHTVDGR